MRLCDFSCGTEVWSDLEAEARVELEMDFVNGELETTVKVMGFGGDDPEPRGVLLMKESEERGVVPRTDAQEANGEGGN